MPTEMATAHRRAARVATDWIGKAPNQVHAHLTWGPTVVVELVIEGGLTVFAKASSGQDVHTEAAVIERVRGAGLPAPEVLAVGIDPELPGEKWMLTRAVPGVALVEIGLRAATTERTLTELADLYAALHQVTLPGFGPLADGARHGTYRTWSDWSSDGLERALDRLHDSGSVPAGFVDRARTIGASMAPVLDARPGSLLHADLGDGETFVDPETGSVTGLVDWGSALLGDPLYDVARFVSGGPADDPRPALAFPTLHSRYLDRTGMDRGRAAELLRFYRFQICLVEAAWGEAFGWTPGLIDWAERLAETLP